MDAPGSHAPTQATPLKPPATRMGTGVCGMRGLGASPWMHIARGQEVSQCEWPWQVSLRYYGTPFCGGTSISNTWVRTATHCFFEKATAGIQVALGCCNLRRPRFYKVTQVINHPDSNTRTFNLRCVARTISVASATQQVHMWLVLSR